MATRTPLRKVPIHLQSAQSRLLIKGGKIVNDDQSIFSDIYVEDGVIKQIGSNLVIPGGARTIEAKGKLIIPGGIDVNTHFHVPGKSSAVPSVDDFYQGTKAALAGATTMIFDYVLPDPGESLLDAYRRYREAADTKACCDFGLHVCVTSWSDKVSQDMETLTKDHGVNSFHVFLSDEHMLKDSELYQVMKQCRKLGALCMVHAENGSLVEEKTKDIIGLGITGPEGLLMSRPEEAEAEAVYRTIALASQANAPVYITKVMSRSAADVISESRRSGKVVFGEAVGVALALDGRQYFSKDWQKASALVVTPPLRPDPLTPEYLLDLLANGDLQLTGSDNCSHSSEQRSAGMSDFRKIPPGVNGVEERMAVLWERGVATGKMDPCRFVAVTSTMAAKIFNLYPRKGRIAVGSDADIIIWDPTATRTISAKTHQLKSDVNVFEGMTCHGVPQYIISSGCVILDEDGLRVTQGNGQFVNMPCSAEFIYSRLWEREKIYNKPLKIEREPYTGPAVTSAVTNNVQESASDTNGTGGKGEEFHNRPATRSGGRNMQDSSFAFSGAQIDDTAPQRNSSRVIQPPGGKSSSLW